MAWTTTASGGRPANESSTEASSPRSAGSVTKASHDQWALRRRCVTVYNVDLQAGVSGARIGQAARERDDPHHSGRPGQH
jgi:hypothetical protein